MSADGRSGDAQDRALAWWLLVGGALGFAAAAVLLAEKITLLADSSYVPSCNISPVLSCGSVMKTQQAEAFGFPNPIIGVAAFPMVAAAGAAVLAGGRLARWYWLTLQAGVTFGIAFTCWLAFQSLYRIGALCPYCMVVWVVVVPTFWYVTIRNLIAGAFGERARRSRAARVLAVWHAPTLLAVYLGLVALIGVRFWSYWSSLL